MSLSESASFDYPKSVANYMHEHFINFSSLTAFHYQSYIMYLILNKFSINFENLMDPQVSIPYGIPSIIHRTSFVRNQSFGFLHFVDKFISQVYLLIYEEQFPRVFPELQECLYPSIETYVGDGILYKDYTIIRVYGLEISPYKLITFLT